MRPYIVKYVLIFLLVLILIDLTSFFIFNKKEETDSYLFLKNSVANSLKVNNLEQTNSLLDSYSEKVILEINGKVITSNFGNTQKERIKLAEDNLQGSIGFWKPLLVSDKPQNQIIYHKVEDINYFNKILMNTLYSFLLTLCIFPVLVILYLDIKGLLESVEYLRYYLESTRKQLAEAKVIKENETKIQEYEKLNKKYSELKTKNMMVKQDSERKKNEITKLKEQLVNMRNDIFAVKNEKRDVEKELKDYKIEKKKILQSLGEKELDIKAKAELVHKYLAKISELETILKEIRDHSQIQENELNRLRKSSVTQSNFMNMEQKFKSLEYELVNKNNDIQGLMDDLNRKLLTIEELKQRMENLNLQKIRAENDLENAKTKTTADKDVINALVNENNTLKDELRNLKTNLQETKKVLDKFNNNETSITDEITKLNEIISRKDEIIDKLIKESKQKENEVKEFTLENLDRLSAIKRFESQIGELTRDNYQKDSIIESLNTRLEVKDKIINSLNQDLSEFKENEKKKSNQNDMTIISNSSDSFDSKTSKNGIDILKTSNNDVNSIVSNESIN